MKMPPVLCFPRFTRGSGCHHLKPWRLAARLLWQTQLRCVRFSAVSRLCATLTIPQTSPTKFWKHLRQPMIGESTIGNLLLASAGLSARRQHGNCSPACLKSEPATCLVKPISMIYLSGRPNACRSQSSALYSPPEAPCKRQSMQSCLWSQLSARQPKHSPRSL